jgi:hypothetical protein
MWLNGEYTNVSRTISVLVIMEPTFRDNIRTDSLSLNVGEKIPFYAA